MVCTRTWFRLRWSTPVRQDESLHWLGQRSVWRRNWTRPDQTTAFEFHSSLDGPVPVWFCIGRRPNSVDPGVDGVRSTLPSGAAQLQGRPLQPRRVVHLFLSSSPQPRRAAPTLLLPQQEKKRTKKANKMHFFVSFRFVRSPKCVLRFPSSIASRALRRLPRVVERGLERRRACGAKRSTLDDGQQRRRTRTAAGVGANGAWTRRTSHVVTRDVLGWTWTDVRRNTCSDSTCEGADRNKTKTSWWKTCDNDVRVRGGGAKRRTTERRRRDRGGEDR